MAHMNFNKGDSKFESNMQMKSKSFGIGDASAIIDILRNRMYSKPIQTLVQEYICNARDAMIEAGTIGKGQRIKVTAPTRLDTQFRVRDYGVGLSQERVENVFTMYGNSTKRNTNGQIGGYGLGAKSAWAYTDSFTVISFYNGVKTSYLCHVGKDNIGSMDVMSTEKTNELNGVEIVVTVKPEHTRDFISAINRCLTHWNADHYELNVGLTPQQSMNYDDGFALVIKTHDYWSDSGHYLLVDDIIFPFPDSLKYELDLKNGVSFRVKTGEVDIAPSRESVIDNEKIRALSIMIKNHMDKITNEFNSVKDLTLKIEAKLKYKDVIYTPEIQIDSNFTISSSLGRGENAQLKAKTTRRLANKNGKIVFDSEAKANERWCTFDIDTSTYVIVADDTVKFVPSKLTHHLSGQSFKRNTQCIIIKDMKDIHPYFHDKLTFVEASTLALPPKQPRAQRVKTTVVTCKELTNEYANGVYGYEKDLSAITKTILFKYPFTGFKDDYKLRQILVSKNNSCAVALRKEDYDDSKLPTMEEYVESKAKNERKKIGNFASTRWETILTKITGEDIPTFGTPPETNLLSDDEIKLHNKLVKEAEEKIRKIKNKYPLLVVIEELRALTNPDEFVFYVQSKQKENKKLIKKGA